MTRDDFKRTEQEGPELRGREWADRFEGPDSAERRALRRKARRKLRQRTREGGER